MCGRHFARGAVAFSPAAKQLFDRLEFDGRGDSLSHASNSPTRPCSRQQRREQLAVERGLVAAPGNGLGEGHGQRASEIRRVHTLPTGPWR